MRGEKIMGDVAPPAERGESSASPAHPLSLTYTKKSLGPHWCWADDLKIADGFAQAYGLTLQLTDADYQVAKLVGRGVRLVLYPHKTSAGHHHLRVRDENSSDKALAQKLMALLDYAAGFNCTFSFHWPKNPLAHQVSRDVLNPAKRAVLEAECRSAGAQRSELSPQPAQPTTSPQNPEAQSHDR
jgi:hypothetical protein